MGNSKFINHNIEQIIQNLQIGDKLSINDFKAKYTVCGLSQNYALAHYGQHYTIIQRTPMPEKYNYNGVREGDFRCAPDWWVFGYLDGYHFTDKDWVKKYMLDLEVGDTEMSQKHHAPIYHIAVVGHTDKVYRNSRATPTMSREV